MYNKELFLARTVGGKWLLLNHKPVVIDIPPHSKKRSGDFTTGYKQVVDSAKNTKDAGWPFRLPQRALDRMLIEEADGYNLGRGEYIKGEMIYEINSPTPNFYLSIHKGKPVLTELYPVWFMNQWVPAINELCYIRMCDQYVKSVYYLDKVDGVIPVMITIVLKDSKVKLL